MGKEAELMKAIKHNDHNKIQKLFLPEQGVHVKKIPQSSPERSLPGGRIRLQLNHININHHESDTGYTPLISAVLQGNKDIAETLIFYSADVNTSDKKGNTALHMATFQGQTEMIELLIRNGADVNIQNSDGNAPVHIICQSDSDNRIVIITKLLKNLADLSLKNKKKETALDVAAMFNKKDVLSAMLDHESSLRYNTTAIIEGAIRGHQEIVQLLLDYGVSPNGISDLKKTGPLHEATRFLRLPVAELLLKYGACPQVKNMNNESAEEIAKKFPLAEKFTKLFKEYSLIGATCFPKFVDNVNIGTHSKPSKDYPELPNDMSWTENDLQYCNSCTPNNPNTNILDDDLRSMWVMQDSNHVWTVLDLHHQHTLSGITIYGWDSPEMIKGIDIQKGEQIKGPWISIGSFTCQRKGSTNPKDKGIPQTFKDFDATSRFWRIHILHNHGGTYSCFHGIKLFGADERIKCTLERLSLPQYAENIICNGCNTYRKFLLMEEQGLKAICVSNDDVKAILAELARLRKIEFQLKQLKWVQPPPFSVTEGTPLPDIIVKGDEACTDELQVCLEGTSVPVIGKLKSRLSFCNSNDPPKATFTGLHINTCGCYRILIRSVEKPEICLRAPAEIEIKPKSKLSEDVQKAFMDIENMLSELQDT